jgi:hypothetical protein
VIDLFDLSGIAQRVKDCENGRRFCKHDNGSSEVGSEYSEAVPSLTCELFKPCNFQAEISCDCPDPKRVVEN